MPLRLRVLNLFSNLKLFAQDSFSFLMTHRLALFLVLLNSVIYFTWIKIAQLQVAHPDLVTHYPLGYYLPTLLFGALLFFSLWIFLSGLFRITGKNACLSRIPLWVALCFMALQTGPVAYLIQKYQWISFFFETHHPVQISIWACLVAIVIVFIKTVSREKTRKYHYDISVFFTISVIICLLVPSLSPLHNNDIRGWIAAMDGLDGDGQRLLIDAANYSLPWINQTSAFGALPAPVFCNFSYIIGILSLFSGVSALDVFGRLLLFKYLFLVIVIFGSFFFYLFVRYGLSLSRYSATFGGLFYFLFNQVLLYQLFRLNAGSFICVYIFPFTMLFAALSFKNRNHLYAVIGGFSYAACIYLIYPLADIFASTFKWLIFPYLLFLLFYRSGWSIPSKILNLGIFCVSIAIGFSLWVFPHLHSNLFGEQSLVIYYDQVINYYKDMDFRGVLWPGKDFLLYLLRIVFTGLSIPEPHDPKYKLHFDQHPIETTLYIGFLSFLAVFFFLAFRRMFNREQADPWKRIHLAFWGVFALFTSHVVLLGDLSPLNYILEITHLGYVTGLYRFSIIFHISVLALGVFSIDYLITRKNIPFLRVSALYTCLFLVVLFSFLYLKMKIYGGFQNPNFLETVFRIIRTDAEPLSLTIIPLFLMIGIVYLLHRFTSRITKTVMLLASLVFFTVSNVSIVKPKKQFCKPTTLMSAAIVNYQRLSHDPLSYSHIRDKYQTLKHDVSLFLEKAETKNDASYKLAKKLHDAFPADSTKVSVLHYCSKFAREVDSFYSFYFKIHFNDTDSYSTCMYQRNFSIPSVERFNGVVVPQISDGYWNIIFGNELPTLTYPLYDFVNWFGGHNVLRVANRNHIFNIHTELVNGPKNYLSRFYFMSFRVSGISYVVYREQKDDFLLKNGFIRIKNFSINQKVPNFVLDQRANDFMWHPVTAPERNHYKIYFNTLSFGRSFFAKKIRLIPKSKLDTLHPIRDEAEFNRELRLAGGKISSIRTRHEVLIEDYDKDIGTIANTGLYPGKISIRSYMSSKAAFSVDVEKGKGLLVFNQAALRDWVAFVDDRPSKKYFANIGFMGTVVPEGKHLVWFEYRPVSKFLGLVIVLGSLFGLLLWITIRLEKRGLLKASHP